MYFSNKKIPQFLISLLVFLLPSQLAYHFWPSYAFIFGIRVDYFAPTIYLTDILVFLLICLNFKLLVKCQKIFLWILIFAVFNIYFSSIYLVSLYRFIKIFEFISLAIIIKKYDITKPLYYSLIFYSIIGISQFILGRTTGLFYILGERIFSITTPGIALVDIFGRVFMRAYSTFPHPNSLAGFLGIGTIFLLRKNYKFDLWFIFPVLCFILTFSLSAFIAITVYFLLRSKFNKYYIFIFLILSLLLPFVTRFQIPHSIFTESVGQRLTLAVEAGKVISQNFWTGIGLGTFPKFSSIRQPVHNLFLLTFSETGIFGLLIVIYLLLKNFKKYTFLLFVLVVGLFDHYFLTIQQNMLLLSIVFSLW